MDPAPGTVEAELHAAVHERKQVRQLPASCLMRVPASLLAAHSPQLHFQVEEAQRSLRRENAGLPPSAGTGALALEASSGEGMAAHQFPVDDNDDSVPVLAQESKHLLALDVIVQGMASTFNKHAPAGKKKPLALLALGSSGGSGGGGGYGGFSEEELAAEAESMHAEAEHAQEVAEAATAARALAALHGFRFGYHDAGTRPPGAATDALALVPSGSALARAPQSPPPPSPPQPAQPWPPGARDAALARELLAAAAAHTDLHRVEPRHRLVLKADAVGGPQGAGRVTGPGSLREGSQCVFGVAPFVGVTVNHPALAPPAAAAVAAAAATSKALVVSAPLEVASTAVVASSPAKTARTKAAPQAKASEAKALAGGGAVLGSPGSGGSVGSVGSADRHHRGSSRARSTSPPARSASPPARAASPSSAAPASCAITAGRTASGARTAAGVAASLGHVVAWGRGGTLHDRLTRGSRVSDGEARRWIAGVAACLAALHGRGWALGRLDAHAVLLFPREDDDGAAAARRAAKANAAAAEALAAGTAPRAARPRCPEAKVADLTRCGPADDVAAAAARRAAALLASSHPSSPPPPGSVPGCPWRLRDLCRHRNALPPHFLDLDDDDGARAGEEAILAGGALAVLSNGGDGDGDGSDSRPPLRSAGNDLWYLGCLALELTARAPLASWPRGRLAGILPASGPGHAAVLDDLIPARFGPELREVIKGCLRLDPTKRPSALACLELLCPKEAARLRGENLRGWAKKRRRATAKASKGKRRGAYALNEDESDTDTESGTDSTGSSEEEFEDEGEEDDWDDGGKRRIRCARATVFLASAAGGVRGEFLGSPDSLPLNHGHCSAVRQFHAHARSGFRIRVCCLHCTPAGMV